MNVTLSTSEFQVVMYGHGVNVASSRCEANEKFKPQAKQCQGMQNQGKQSSCDAGCHLKHTLFENI